jgi:hypothetical protein
MPVDGGLGDAEQAGDVLDGVGALPIGAAFVVEAACQLGLRGRQLRLAAAGAAAGAGGGQALDGALDGLAASSRVQSSQNAAITSTPPAAVQQATRSAGAWQAEHAGGVPRRAFSSSAFAQSPQARIRDGRQSLILQGHRLATCRQAGRPGA